jgi:preprotein translocase subunit SecB
MVNYLRLETYIIRRIHLEWQGPVDGCERAVQSLTLKATDKQDAQNPRKYRLRLNATITLDKSKENACGFLADVLIEGVFIVPDGLTPEQENSLIHGNGATLLYGVLRGELAAHTGSFPKGRLLLPTIPLRKMAQDIADKAAKKQVCDASGEKTGKRSDQKKARKSAATRASSNAPSRESTVRRAAKKK